LKAEALQEADVYCTKQSKRLKFIYSKEIPAGVLGRWPEARCCSSVNKRSVQAEGGQMNNFEMQVAMLTHPAIAMAFFSLYRCSSLVSPPGLSGRLV
jgi:hypothetical protein